MRQPTRPFGRSIRCSSSSRSSSAGVDLAPRAVDLLVARLGAVGVVGRGEHLVGDLAHPAAVEADGGVEQHQCRDQIRPCRREMQRDRAAERMPDHHTGRRASASSSAASAATLASMVHGAAHDDRPWPSRSGAATATSGRCCVASVSQRWPCPVSPWIARTRAGRAGRSGTCKRVGHGVDAARRARRSSTRRRLVGPPWCHSCMPAPHTALSPAALTEPGLRGTVRVLGGPGTGKAALLIARRGAHRRRRAIRNRFCC